MNVQQMQLNAVRAYIAWVKELYPNKEDGADRLLMVLQIYEWQLRRAKDRKPVNPDQMATLKHGIREAELLYSDIIENEAEEMSGWYAGCVPTNQAQRLCNLLCELILEFTQEVIANEALYPALKPMFDRERAQYRKLKEEAMAID
jgi:hypothetical protein